MAFYLWDDQRDVNGYLWTDSLSEGLPVPIVDSITDGTLVGATATITGSNFYPTSTNGTIQLQVGANTVTITDGDTTWSDTSLTFVVPDLETTNFSYAETVTVIVTSSNSEVGTGTTTFQPVADKEYVNVTSYDGTAEGVIEFSVGTPAAGDQVSYDPQLFDVTNQTAVIDRTLVVNSDLTFTITGNVLNDGDYRIQHIAVWDATDSTWSNSETITITIDSSADVTNDGFTANLSQTSLTTTEWGYSFQPVEAGTYRVIALEDTVSAPTAAEIFTGTGTATQAQSSSSDTTSLLSNTAGEVITGTLTGLTAATAYDFYVAIQDGSSNQLLGDVITATTNATVDTIAPTVSSITVEGIGDTSATVAFTSNEDGQAYVGIYLASASTPTVAEVIAGTGAVDSLLGELQTANVADSVEFTGLTAETEYIFYIVAEDNANNTQSTAYASSSFTTLVDQATPPVWSTIPDQSATQNTAISSFDVSGYVANSPTSYAIVSGPAGLSISSAGIITGTPTGYGTISTVISATNSDGTVSSGAFDWVIAQEVVSNPPVWSTVPSQSATQNSAISNLDISGYVTNSPTAYSITSGPAGLSISSAGVISGTPTGSGTVAMTVFATNGDGSDSTTFNWVIAEEGSSSGGIISGTLYNGETEVAQANLTDNKILVYAAWGGSAIYSGTFDTDSAGAYSVTIGEITSGQTYYVLKESSDGTITSLVKQTATDV